MNRIDGKNQERREEKKKEDQKRERVRKSQKKEDPGARKGRKVAKRSSFPMICGSGGSKSRPAKAAGAEPAGQMRDEELHTVAARSTSFRSQKRKKMDGPGALLQVETSKKRAPLWRKARFEVKMRKTHARTSSGRSDAVSRGRRAGLCTVSKVRKKREGFVAFPKINDGRRVAFGSAKMHFPRQAQYKRHVHQRC